MRMYGRLGAARRVRGAAAAGRRRPRRRLVARRAAGADAPPTRSAVFADRRITDSSIAEDPLAALRTRAEDYAPGRHRPRLDPQHRRGGRPRLHAWTRSSGRRGDAGARAGRPDRGRPGQRHRPAAGRLAVLALRLPDRGGQSSTRTPGPSGVDSVVLAARPGRGGADPGRPPRRRGHHPAVPARRPPWRCPTGRSATCSARSCAGWTPTSPTATRWRRRPASPAWPSARRCASTSGSTRPTAGRNGTPSTARQPRAAAAAAGEDAAAGPDRAGGPEDADEVAEQAHDEHDAPAADDSRGGPVQPLGHAGEAREPAARRARRRRARRRGPPGARRRRSSPTPTGWPAAVASALVARLAAAQAVHGTASVVLTGGGIGTAVLEQVAALAAEPEHARSSTGRRSTSGGATSASCRRTTTSATRSGARRALLDARRRARRAGPRHAAVGRRVRRARRTPPPGTPGSSPRLRRTGRPLPRLDVLLLGMGPEGHVASIFPESPAVADERPVVAVRDCPKPPPTRVSLGFPAINAAEEVWLLVVRRGQGGGGGAGAGGAGRARSSCRPPACTAGGPPAGCWTRRRRASSAGLTASPLQVACKGPAAGWVLVGIRLPSGARHARQQHRPRPDHDRPEHRSARLIEYLRTSSRPAGASPRRALKAAADPQLTAAGRPGVSCAGRGSRVSASSSSASPSASLRRSRT